MSMLKKTAVVVLVGVTLGAAGPAGDWAEKGVASAPPAILAGGGGARGEDWTRGFGAMYDELLKNLIMPNRFFTTRHAQPGPAWPDDVYLWDTAFVAEVWRRWDVKTGEEITRAVLDHADRGRLQHAVGSDEYYKDTQPPVMAWAVWRLYLAGHDRAYLAYAYPILKNYNRWLYANRRLPGGLFFWVHPYESGMDNSPRFSNANVTRIADMKDLAAIDLSSYLVLQNATLAAMARELGLPDDEKLFTERAEALKKLINDNLWDEADGLYYDRDLKGGKPIRVKSVASLLPLFCAVPDAARAQRLRGHIMDPAEFNTPMPLPSVARDDPAFGKDMWRGPVWINTAYMVVLGLDDYGYHDEAAEIAFRIVDGVYRNYRLSGNIYEYFDPDHDGVSELGRKNSLYKKLTHNDKPKPHFVGWDGLVNNLVVERLMGCPAGDGPCAAAFPPAAAGMTFELTRPGRAERVRQVIR